MPRKPHWAGPYAGEFPQGRGIAEVVRWALCTRAFGLRLTKRAVMKELHVQDTAIRRIMSGVPSTSSTADRVIAWAGVVLAGTAPQYPPPKEEPAKPPKPPKKPKPMSDRKYLASLSNDPRVREMLGGCMTADLLKSYWKAARKRHPITQAMRDARAAYQRAKRKGKKK